MAKIELRNVGVTFSVHQERRVSFKEYMIRGLFRRAANPAMRVRALEGINLSVRDGERIGVIGHNGAGKSTLLKTLAGVYPPTAGMCEVEGKVCSLFDITLGFEFEASGWDNIRYRAFLQGESSRSVRNKLEEIAAFSELGDFLNIAVRNYSAGMQMRLAFSIATAINPEVLLVDEVLAVGDLAFTSKAQARMRELMNTSRIMVIVAHDLKTIANMCTRVVWMQHGQIVAQGPPREIIDRYTEASTHKPVGPAPVKRAPEPELALA